MQYILKEQVEYTASIFVLIVECAVCSMVIVQFFNMSCAIII